MKPKLKGEDAEQATLFQIAAYKQHPWELLFSIPNGGKRHIITAMKLKATGLKPGIPDIFLPVAKHHFHGLFIELKMPGGTIRPEQKKWHQALRNQGYKVEICYGCDEAIKIITEYLDN